jgi:hypothetical protein
MLSDKQLRSLEYFQNKIVTFFVPKMNREFNEEQSINYFVGKLIKLDESGCWYEHPASKCMSFIFYDKILSIAEEQVVSESSEEPQNNEVLQPPPEPEPVQKTKIPQKLDVFVEAEQLGNDNIKPPESIDEFQQFISGS